MSRPGPAERGDERAPVRIRVAGLTKVYRGVPVLDGVDLELRAGEVVGIIGPGGEGKSLLLKHLPRLLVPDGGRVEIDGQDLARLDARALAHVRERFGYVFQNYALFDFMTVGDNVAFPLRQLGPVQRPREADIEARVRARLADVGLAHAFSQYPREADPEIALYDDPSAGLDPVTSSKIFALIEAMHARVPDATTVVVSHDIDRMRAICHRWVMIAQGRVVFDGTDEALADAAPAVRAFVFGAAGASSDARRAGARA